MKLNINRERTFSDKRLDILICVFLGLLTFSTYSQVINHEFVWDDELYITSNQHIQRGLIHKNILWSFTAEVAGNWHPLTVLSHMLDCQIYGLNSGKHHITSLIFHLINTILLFVVLKRMTNALWQSAFVAALFALHPLHVESVALVAERKDVLSTFFWILTMWAYTRYAKHPETKTYLPVLVFFILGLMSKPMLVTLPFVLILLDFWPLKRLRFEWSSDLPPGPQGVPLARIILEKTPLFVLSAASCIITYLFQESASAVAPSEAWLLHIRISNAFVSYIGYIMKMIWPFNLAYFYPHPGMWPLWQVTGSIILLSLVTFLAIRSIRQHTFFAVGWFWYIGTLVPVIGFVQVGAQAMADRYTYIPLIGIFIIIAWGVPELFAKWQHKNKILATLSMTVFLILMPLTWMQVQHWENGISLFGHALDVTEDNNYAHNNLGFALANQGRIEDAIKHFSSAVNINPGYLTARNNLGLMYAKQGNPDAAVKHFSLALRINPESGTGHISLGAALSEKGDIGEAIEHLEKGLKICPESFEGHYNMGNILSKQGKLNEAIGHYKRALTINPGYAMAHYQLGGLLAKQGKSDEAIYYLEKALQINDNFSEAHSHLGYALLLKGRTDEAIKHCHEAIRIAPEKSINAYYNLACIYARKNEIHESIVWLKKAIEKGFNDWKTLKTDKDLTNIRNTADYAEIMDTLVEPKPN